MEQKKDLEIDTIENVERVLDNIFSDEKDISKYNTPSKKEEENVDFNNDFFPKNEIKTPPKLFVNSNFVAVSEVKEITPKRESMPCKCIIIHSFSFINNRQRKNESPYERAVNDRSSNVL